MSGRDLGLAAQADDIEHGILRGNATAPASLGALLKLPFLARPQFKKGDPRREYVVTPVDPRIHFALVCGAKSCPPIKLYTPDNLDDGLQVGLPASAAPWLTRRLTGVVHSAAATSLRTHAIITVP